MGWLWSSSPSGTTAADAERAGSTTTQTPSPPRRDVSLTDEQRARIFGQFSTPKQDQRKKSSREVNEDAEIENFLRELVATEPAKTPADDATASETGQYVAPVRTDHDRVREDGSLNIHPVALYPATMSCRQAFDQAFYCQSLGGKFNDIYRFGHVKNCSEQWGAFWFCMRTRTLPAKDKEVQIRDYYRERDERRRKENKGSSEDVWELRTEAVKSAFQKDPDVDEGDVQVRE